MRVKEETVHKGMRLPKTLVDKIESSADKEQRNFSEQVIYILKKYYDLQESK